MSVRSARSEAKQALYCLEQVKPKRQLDLPESPEKTELKEVKEQVQSLVKHFGLGDSQMTFAELVHEVRNEFIDEKHPSSQRKYNNYIDSVLLPKWGDSGLNDITNSTVRAWAKKYVGPQGGQVGEPAKILRLLMLIAKEKEYIRHEIKVSGAFSSKRGEAVRLNDIKRIVRFLSRKIESDNADIRDYAILLAIFTGERSTALTTLRANEVDFRTGLATKKRKGGKVEPLPYSKVALNLLRRIRPKSRTGYFFPGETHPHITGQSLRRYFQRLCLQLRVTLPSGDQPKIHSLRHSFVTSITNLPGHSLKHAATLAGHSNTTTTSGYSHKDLAEARKFADLASQALLPKTKKRHAGHGNPNDRRLHSQEGRKSPEGSHGPGLQTSFNGVPRNRGE